MYQRVGPSAFKKDLTNTLLLSSHLGEPHQHFRSIHVGGTNGKGSVAHSLASVLYSCGYAVGLYTSPHLKSFTERIKVNGNPIPEREVARFVTQNLGTLEKVKPSFFEMSVVMAFDHFAREAVDVAVVEVGLGGRLDSTNIITPALSVITNVGYDHQDMLGTTLPEIAFEKAGIIKPGIPVVISEHQTEVAQVFEKRAQDIGAPLSYGSKVFELSFLHASNTTNTYRVTENGERWPEGLTVDLIARYQEKNLAGVLEALARLRERDFVISMEAVQDGLSQIGIQTGLKGRWQIISQHPLTICDSAHNVDAFKLIFKELDRIGYQQLRLVFGTVRDKNVNPILQIVPKETFCYFTQARIPRAMDAYQLQQEAERHGLRGIVVSEVNQALETARADAGPRDLVFVGGSMFVVAEVNDL